MMPGIARGQAIAPLSFGTGGCNSMGGNCLVNPANGNLLLQVAPPAGDSGYLAPVLSFSSTNVATVSEIGNGWTHTFKRQVVGGCPTVAQVYTGTGQVYAYGGPRGGNAYFTPGPGSTAVNSLFAQSACAGFTETQPDGTTFTYRGTGGGLSGFLTKITNPAGAVWSMSYDSSFRVSVVTDPFLRATTFTYNATTGKIAGIQDPFGRNTGLVVNSSGNLAQITSPELCIVSLVYDLSNRPICWINPLGDRTSYAYDGSNRVTAVTTPLGQVTTLTYNTNQTVITNPLGYLTTLNFTGGALTSAIDGAGNLTSYSWDGNNAADGDRRWPGPHHDFRIRDQ